MWPTFLSLWLALSGIAPRRPAPRRRPAFRRPPQRPRVEALEGRSLLSAGALDPTFGHGAGYVITAQSSLNDDGEAVLSQPDGKIILAGQVTVSEPGAKKHTTTTHRVFGVVRYNVDGSLDTSFG